uniref:AP complex mu/sigma subunit domain-containing protein n=2 Tax=Strigops habroptila TaxID=2489341 RepID=A0A672UXJ2_STRHB
GGVLGCFGAVLGLFWAVLGCFGAVLGCFGVFWAVLGCFRGSSGCSPCCPPRYASLYFCCAIEGQDNELITLELIHRYVELLDKYFGSVCELDIIFNFEKAYFILDEFVMGGEIQDTSKKSVLKAIEQADLLQE